MTIDPDLYRIVDLNRGDQDRIAETAKLLQEGFKGRSHAWPTMDAALEEVEESLANGRVSRVALNAEGAVVGWIGAQHMEGYPGKVWELHPLVVDARQRRLGLGRMLVTDLEEKLRAVGCRTIYLGTDDEAFETSLGGADLYPDLPKALANIQNPGGHPYEFYQRLGYTIVGVLPDANGPGKPDIFMAKRL